MRTRMLHVAALLLLAGAAVRPGGLSGQAVPVQGAVYNAQSIPIPGLTVSLVHPVLGRGAPAITDMNGFFVFNNVPLRSDPYYLEIYWGQALYYRQIIYVHQPMNVGRIFLN